MNGKVLTFFVFCIYTLLIIIGQNYGQVLTYLRSNYFPCSCTCGNCSRDLLANISECYSFKELEGCCEALTSDIVLTELQEGHVLNCDNRDDNDDESRRRRVKTTTNRDDDDRKSFNACGSFCACHRCRPHGVDDVKTTDLPSSSERKY